MPSNPTQYNKEYYELHKEEINRKAREKYHQNLDASRERSKKYYHKDIEQSRKLSRQRGAKYKAAHPEIVKLRARMQSRVGNSKPNQSSSRQTLRKLILKLLNGICNHCGFSDERALQIDHINGGGNKDRKLWGSTDKYYKHILEVDGHGYQLLCANCNMIKKHEQHEVRVNYYQ